MPLTRRQLLRTSALVTPLALCGCAGFIPSGAAGGSAEAGRDTLAFTTWGTDAELAGFRAAIEGFERANAGARVELNSVPYESFFTNVDAQLQSGNAPDVFRVDYDTLGIYAGRGQLLDLTDLVPADFGERFTEPLWRAVQNDGAPYGVPHHTDTSAIVVNTAALEQAGITSVPTSLDDAWTWREFGEVADRLRSQMPPDAFPFAYNWQSTGVTRWLSWLFQADGRFLDDDLTSPAIDSEAGRAALDFTRDFFPRGWVPPSSSVKSTTYASDLWYSETVAMTFTGAFLIPDADATLDFEWTATYCPRDERGGGDLGGNAVVATAESGRNGKGELAAAFLDHLTTEEAMLDFCRRGSLLPTRRDLTAGGLDFEVRPELAPVFLGQASTVQPQDAAQIASPSMSVINTVLTDQLELAFVGGQGVEDTVAGIADGIATATAGQVGR